MRQIKENAIIIYGPPRDNFVQESYYVWTLPSSIFKHKSKVIQTFVCSRPTSLQATPYFQFDNLRFTKLTRSSSSLFVFQACLDLAYKAELLHLKFAFYVTYSNKDKSVCVAVT